MVEHVFVYGTLKRGCVNHRVMTEARARRLGEARTQEAHPLVVGRACGLPYLLPEPGSGLQVNGEVYAVGRAGLTMLDAFEGVDLPRFYRRARIIVAVAEDGAAIEAWAYFRERQHIAGGLSAPLSEFASES